MYVNLIPLIGPFHLRFPLYNSVTVKDILKTSEPEVVVTTVLQDKDFNTLQWQDTFEIVLPQTVIPWVKKQGLPLYGVFEPSPDPQALDDFKRYAREYPKLSQELKSVEAKLRPVAELLEQSLDLDRIQKEVLPALCDYQIQREHIFGDGPGTDWLRERIAKMAKKILEQPFGKIAVLASAEHIPFLQEALTNVLVELPRVEPTGESRERSLLDFAFRTDVPEVGNLLNQLRNIDKPEARYHEANLLLANGHTLEALEILEKTSQGNFSEPYYLPGYLLARLGQLYDLKGDRNAALRCYKGVRALNYAPLEALEQAASGLEKPFAYD